MSNDFHAGYRRMYLGGQLRDAADGRRETVVCPATERGVAEVAWAGVADAEAALAAAEAAFAGWAAQPLPVRRDWMHKLAEAATAERDLLQNCVMHETGKTWEQADEDVTTLIKSLRYYPEQMARFGSESLPDDSGTYHHELVYEPVGVVVAYLAWNFPLLNLAFKIGPALAAGCTIILKPAPQTPLSAYLVGELCQRIGLPAGVVNIVAGPNDPVATTLSASQIPRLLTLIGSTATGRRVVADGATSIKRYSMELGGNAPVIVLPDADLELAASVVTTLKFANAGQICVAPNRVLVHKSVAGTFADKVVNRARQVKVGFGRGSGATMGPLISVAARDRIATCVREAVDAGARLLHGGRRPATPERGYFFEPTVLEGVRQDMRVCRQEIFGPVVSLMQYADVEEALRLANDTDAGLSSFVFGRDRGLLDRIARRLRFGEVMINGFKYYIALPHIGIKDSGVGCDCSALALHDYLNMKRITTTEET